VNSLTDDNHHVALFSHNPGITEFASSLTNTQIIHMPTCSVFAVSVEVDRWIDFGAAEKQFVFFFKPD
jgi:phosphohistidine phosphatase